MGHRLFTAFTLILFILIAGCGRWNDPGAERIAAMEKELAALRAELSTLESRGLREVVVQEPVAETAPAPADNVVPKELEDRIAATRAVMAASNALLDEVDDDLAALENDLDEQDAELETLRADVEKLSSAMQSQSQALSSITDEFNLLYNEVISIQEIANRFSVEDGALVLKGSDLILQQGLREDGRPDGTGRIYTEVNPNQARPGQR